MSIKDLESLDDEFLLISDIAQILGRNQQAIRLQAHEDPSKLGFPVVVIGRQVRIPRLAFIKFCKGELV